MRIQAFGHHAVEEQAGLNGGGGGVPIIMMSGRRRSSRSLKMACRLRRMSIRAVPAIPYTLRRRRPASWCAPTE